MSYEIKSALLNLDSYKAFNEVILGDDPLHDKQGIDVLKMLYRKRGIILYDTGLGKTFLCAGAFRALWMENKSRKFLMFIKNRQLAQTPDKIRTLTGLSVLATDGTKDSLYSLFSGGLRQCQILLATHSCLNNKYFMQFMLENKSLFTAVCIDEGHKLSNYNNSTTADNLKAMLQQFEYVWALTATPITTSVAQLAKLANIIDPNSYPSSTRLLKQLKSGTFCIEDDPLFFINRKGEDFGRISKPVGRVCWCDPTIEQRNCKFIGGDPLVKMMKGPGAVPQAEALVNLILKERPNRGIIYVYQHSVREWILPFLDKAGITYGLINGFTSREDAKRIMDQFNDDGMYDVIITSTEEAIDLDCEYVCFYEFTVNVKQLEGRAQRGFNDKELRVWFMVTRDTNEAEYFVRSFLERSEEIQHIVSKSYEEIISACEEIKQTRQI